MGHSSAGSLKLVPILVALVYCQRTEWDASDFPNPTAGDYKRCNMRTTANICDPDGVLNDSQRYRLNHDLHQLESRTRQNQGSDFCQKKGITAAMGIVKHVRGGSVEAVKEMANQMLRKWSLDNQCQKSVVFVVATEDRLFWAARDQKVPVFAAELTQIFSDQKKLFQQGNYQQALNNILQQTWEKALSKQGGEDAGVSPGRDKGGVRPPSPRPPPGYDDRGVPGKKSGGGLLPHIPIWIWLVLIAIIIPTICCCCIFYCCCCRKGSSSSPRRQGPSDIEGGGGSAPARGSRSGGMGNFLSGLGGAGIGTMASRLLSGGGGAGGLFGGRGRQAPPDDGYQGGGAYPAEPHRPPVKRSDIGTGGGGGGKGLYPSVAVRDEGGGGGW